MEMSRQWQWSVTVLSLWISFIKVANQENPGGYKKHNWMLQFIDEFASFHRLENLVYHVEDQYTFQVSELLFKQQYMTQKVASKSMEQGVHHGFHLDDADLNIVIFNENTTDSQYLQTIFSWRNFSHKEHWLVYNASSRLDLTGLKMDLDDDFYVFEGNETAGVEIWEMYQVSGGLVSNAPGAIDRKLYGNWRQGELEILNPLKWKRRSNLEGIHFTFTSLPDVPYINAIIDNPDGTSTFTDGIFVDIFKVVQTELNFTYTLKKPPDGVFGSLQESGEWNGLIKVVIEKQADAVICDLTVTIERSRVISFTVAPDQVFNRFFIPNPAGSYNFWVYSEPLHWKSWLAILIFNVVIPPILFITVQNGKLDEGRNEFRLGKSYVFTIGAMPFQRGWSVEPSSIKGKFAFFSILMGGCLVYWHWEAMLISYLTSRQIALPFKDLKEMIEKTDTKIALVPNSASEDEFKQSTDPLWQRAWKERVQPNINNYPMTVSELMRFTVENSGYAFYNVYSSGRYSKMWQNCSVIDIPAKYNFKSIAYAFPKYSPFIGPFNYVLEQMRERGSMEKIKGNYATQAQVCPDTSGQALGFDSCFSAFLLLLTGLSISSVLMFLETCFGLFGIHSSVPDRKSKKSKIPIGEIFAYEKYDPSREDLLQAKVDQLERKMKKMTESIQNCHNCQRKMTTKTPSLSNIFETSGLNYIKAD